MVVAVYFISAWRNYKNYNNKEKNICEKLNAGKHHRHFLVQRNSINGFVSTESVIQLKCLNEKLKLTKVLKLMSTKFNNIFHYQILLNVVQWKMQSGLQLWSHRLSFLLILCKFLITILFICFCVSLSFVFIDILPLYLWNKCRTYVNWNKTCAKCIWKQITDKAYSSTISLCEFCKM